MRSLTRDRARGRRKGGAAGDLILGLAGSIVGGWLFRALGFSPGAGRFALPVVAFIGAAIVIAAQRQFWHARA